MKYIFISCLMMMSFLAHGKSKIICSTNRYPAPQMHVDGGVEYATESLNEKIKSYKKVSAPTLTAYKSEEWPGTDFVICATVSDSE